MLRNARTLLLLTSVLCLTVCSGYAASAAKTEEKTYEVRPLTNESKKLINFIPELAIQSQSTYDLSHFKPVETNQTLFELEKGDSNTTALAFDRKRYAFIGANIKPARIIKYDVQTMKRVSALDLPAGEDRDETRVAALIAINPETVIHASFTNPAVFTKIDGRTMRITGTLKGTVERVNDKYIRSMTYDGKYVYAANFSTPSKIIKIDPVTMQRVDSVSFEGLEISDVTAITIVGNYIVGVCGRDHDTNATIFRLPLNDLHRTPEVISIPGFSKYHSICTDGKNIYAGTFTDPIQVVKVDALSPQMKFISSFSGEKEEEAGNFSIVYDGRDVIVGTWNFNESKNDKLIKLDTDTMRRKDALVTPSKFPADLMYLEPYIYTCSDKPTGNVVRLKF